MNQISIIFGPANFNMGETLGITKQFTQFHQENGMLKNVSMRRWICYIITGAHDNL